MSEKKSTHQALVVPIEMLPHPDPETTALSIVKVHDYVVVVRTADWIAHNKGIYIQPDTLVNTELPQFSFLKDSGKFHQDCTKGGKWARVTAKRLRGVISYGLLIPAPENSKVGDDYWDSLNCIRYETPDSNDNGKVPAGPNESVSNPNLPYSLSKYDIDNGVAFARKVFTPGELVISSLKYHGENVRFVYHDNQYWCGSRSMWKREYTSVYKPDREELITKLGHEKGTELFNKLMTVYERGLANPTRNQIWTLLRESEPLQKFLRDNPQVVVFGELIGKNPGYRYKVPKGQIGLKVFDILRNGEFLSTFEARDLTPDLPWVTIVHENLPFDIDFFLKFIENMPIYDNEGAPHEEGIVVKPIVERRHPKYGRVAYKFVTPQYLGVK